MLAQFIFNIVNLFSQNRYIIHDKLSKEYKHKWFNDAMIINRFIDENKKKKDKYNCKKGGLFGLIADESDYTNQYFSHWGIAQYINNAIKDDNNEKISIYLLYKSMELDREKNKELCDILNQKQEGEYVYYEKSKKIIDFIK